jgi:hypothetical protein
LKLQPLTIQAAKGFGQFDFSRLFQVFSDLEQGFETKNESHIFSIADRILT